jgi:hypothetical protein
LPLGFLLALLLLLLMCENVDAKYIPSCKYRWVWTMEGSPLAWTFWAIPSPGGQLHPPAPFRPPLPCRY